MCNIRWVLGAMAYAAGLSSLAIGANALSPEEIISRSVAANERDWQAAPAFSFVERDLKITGGAKTVRTYEVKMIEGSPYMKLTAINDHPLSPEQQKAEDEKAQKAIAQRRAESPAERAKRVRQYERERAQDHLLMTQMTRAFTFKLIGQEAIAGRTAYVLQAEPRPDYRPVNRDAKILTGMRGRMWIDQAEFHWAKVQAEVFRPVSFAYSFAKVGPGTRIILEEKPVSGSIWQPSRFRLDLAASILWRHRDSVREETYTNHSRR